MDKKLTKKPTKAPEAKAATPSLSLQDELIPLVESIRTLTTKVELVSKGVHELEDAFAFIYKDFDNMRNFVDQYKPNQCLDRESKTKLHQIYTMLANFRKPATSHPVEADAKTQVSMIHELCLLHLF